MFCNEHNLSLVDFEVHCLYPQAVETTPLTGQAIIL
jgi:hypothetical protein